MSLSSTTTAEQHDVASVGRDSSLPTLAQWLTRTSCVVTTIDVQNDFCHPKGAVAQMGNDMSAIIEMMPGLNRLVALARNYDVPLIHIRTGLSDWFDSPAWSVRGRAGAVFDAQRVPVVREGSWGAEFFQVEPAPGELVLTKYRYSAFAYTPLELALRAVDATTLILAGTATHQCVEATGRDAIGRGFYPVIVSDAAASRVRSHHDFALDDFQAHLGAVVSVDDLTTAWQSEDLRVGREANAR